MIDISFDHLAVLVENVDSSAKKLSNLGFHAESASLWPDEGTKEIYISLNQKANHTGRLLLIEALGSGPYKKALLKRGPGIHHFALQVPDLDLYIKNIYTSGWYLHLHSLESISNRKTAWLTRPHLPLIEVYQENNSENKTPFVEKIKMEMDPQSRIYFQNIGLECISATSLEEKPGLFLNNQWLALDALL